MHLLIRNELLNNDKSKLIRCKGTDSQVNTLKKAHLLKMIIIVLDRTNINLVYIKQSLSCYDDKTHILEDGITSYAHTHYNVEEYIKQNYFLQFFICF